MNAALVDYFSDDVVINNIRIKEELAHKLVYNSKLLKVGEVIDIGYSKHGNAAIVVKLKNGKEEINPK